MDATKPSLYIDLEKAVFKEELHPRDKKGEFAKKNGGGNAGKTGVASKGAAAKTVTPKAKDAPPKADKSKKKKAKKAKPAAQKPAAQKPAAQKPAAQKPAAQKPVAKTPEKKPATKHLLDGILDNKEKVTEVPKGSGKKAVNRALQEPIEPGKSTKPVKPKKPLLVVNPKAPEKDMSPNSRDTMETKTIEVPHGDKPKTDPLLDKQNQAIESLKTAEKKPENTQTVDKMWSSKEVQALMKQDPKKRPEDKIRLLAGKISTENDKLARYVTLQMGKSRGLNLLMQVNRIGDVGDDVINQETGYYGDLLQAARSSMYETLYAVMRASQNPKPGVSVGAHVVNRMRQKLHEDIYDLMNTIPAPNEIRTAIADYRKGETTLTQQLGHTPSDEELASYLEENSDNFKKAPIMAAPEYDEKTGQWVAVKERIKDPTERLKMLKLYTSQQKTTSLDENIASEGEKGIAAVDNMSDNTQMTPDEVYEKKERQQELKDKIPKALKAMGLDEKEMLVFTVMFGSPSSKIKKGSMTKKEVADAINKMGGYGEGQQATESWVNKYFRSAMEKLMQARASKHPALEELAMLKSLFYNTLMKALYEFDLIKSLNSFGVGFDILEAQHTRTVSGVNLYSLKKSLAPYEYIGSVVVTEDGGIHARLVEFVLPEDNMLYKSFNASMDSLKKSMFPHKGKSNHEVNQNAAAYVKNNSGKYKSLSEAQHSAAKAKKGSLTWSEQLLVDNPGSAWITWGGKRVLIDVGDGKILYDSANEAHREEKNQGAPEDKIEFHHEKEELKNQGLEDTEENRAKIDHGIQAFKEQMEGMKKEWAAKDEKGRIISGHKKDVMDVSQHRTNDAYASLTEEQRQEVEDAENKAQALGHHMLEGKKVDILNAIRDYKASGDKDAFKARMKEIGKGVSNSMVTADMMGALANDLSKMDTDSEDGIRKLEEALGSRELSAGRMASNKKMIPEGAFMIGNPVTGKTMVVRVKHGFGEGNKKGWTSAIAEAFDPDGGQHEDLYSWGGLARALGLKNDKGGFDTNLQETLAMKANTTEDRPFMKKISDDEFTKMRANTKQGLKETMAHKDFKLVNESRDPKTKEVTSRTFAMDMPDGTQNTVMVDKDGYITDPVMARLVKQRKAINNVNDLHEVLQGAVGNRAWVTAHFGSDIHVGDALGHHIQLEYDGKGAPRVIGGKYDGYRFMDEKDIPKGAQDPATGEPIKALFKNGRLVDRSFTTKNTVPMEEGNAVLYDRGDGKYKKGRIYAIEGENYKVTDGHGHVVGMFKKDQLKNASEEGKANSVSGQAVVRVGQSGLHRMNVDEVFRVDDAKNQKKIDKLKELFTEAMRQSEPTGAFDSEGNMNSNIELSDAAMRRLKKRLGRSRAGKELLKKFNSAYMKELEIHVPDDLKAKIEAEGVRIGANGTAKISVGKFEQLREVLGGLSMDNAAREFLEDHFNRKDRRPKTEEELRTGYQPSGVDQNSDFGKAYRAQFKSDSFLMDKEKGLYNAQLEGVAHLIERGRGIVGHGMGIGKTIEGVTAALHYKAQKLANGEKPKKTLIVSPAGIQSDWGKEIGKHTNSKALYIGSEAKMKKKDASGKWMKSEKGRHMFGQDGTEQEAMTSKAFLKNLQSVGSEDHDFHIMSYDQFMKHRDALSKSGLYDNIIIDEIHAFKNQAGQRGKSLAETTDAFKNVWGLSGTPMENDAREMYSLIDTITGGRHELGNMKEFTENYLMKDKNGKVIGIKESKAEKLGDILANIVQFRNSSDVKFASGGSVEFPHIIGTSSEANPNPQVDFMGDMVDRSRDHNTTDYYGTKHSVFDFDTGSLEVTGKDGGTYTVQTTAPKNLGKHQEFYDEYKRLQGQHLPESKLKELEKASALGVDSEKGSKDRNKNYLTAMQKLQKFLNAPVAKDMYVPGGKNALDSDETGEQAVATEGGGKGRKKAAGFKPYDAKTGEGHYMLDEKGYKRYFKSDGQGGYERNDDGTPKLLPPLHRDNPKAQYLKQRISTYLDALANENSKRRQDGRPELMPKVVVKSSYTTFGTDIVNNVLKDLEREHPHLAYWKSKVGDSFGSGEFTGEAEDRESTKTGFRGNKDDYASNQGNLWATTVSPAGKEGVDFGNAHLMLMYDQDWNPQRMAQFTARVRRSDSAKTHEQMGRSNSVRIESLHVPGTVEDFMFNAEDSKMGNIQKVVQSTKEAEKAPKFGESEGKISSSRNFTRSQRAKAGAKPKQTSKLLRTTNRPEGAEAAEDEAAATTEKSLKLVILV